MFVALMVIVNGCSNNNPISSVSPRTDSTSQKSASISYSSSDSSVPSEGTVVEGVSVPGIALGDTRAAVEAVYGEPEKVSGTNRNSYKYKVANGGDVSVSFRGADGGEAKNSHDDIVGNVGWYEAVSGWVTTAGVNTTLADENPDAVIEAYPNARVTYTQWGSIYSIIDYEQGIAIYRPWIIYSSGEVLVSMSIFKPREAPPLPEKITYVYTIDLSANKVKGKYHIRAFVGVRDQTHLAAKQANVFARWTYPDGSTQDTQAVTSNSGYAYFELINIPRGTYELSIEDIILEEHRFDKDKSTLSASVKVK